MALMFEALLSCAALDRRDHIRPPTPMWLLLWLSAALSWLIKLARRLSVPWPTKGPVPLRDAMPPWNDVQPEALLSRRSEAKTGVRGMAWALPRREVGAERISMGMASLLVAALPSVITAVGGANT